MKYQKIIIWRVFLPKYPNFSHRAVDLPAHRTRPQLLSHVPTNHACLSSAARVSESDETLCPPPARSTPLAFPLGSKLLQSPWWISRTPTPTEQRPSLFCANSCPTFKFLVGDMRSGSGGISRVIVLTGGLRGGAGSRGAIRTTLRRGVPAPAPRSGRPALAPPQIDLILLTSSSTLSSFCSCTMAVAG
jgi:hypothetical protein